MNRLIEFVRRERLYILLVIFIILINIVVFVSGDSGERGRGAGLKDGARNKTDYSLLREAEMEKMLVGNRPLAVLVSLASLLIFAVLFLGILIDLALISFRFAKRRIDISTYGPHQISWNIVDVARVVILFLFFGYMLVIIESLLAGVFPAIKNDNFRMMVNSSILDILGAVFVVYFTVSQYREKLVSLGLSVKNFFKNIFYGIIGYVATVPILIGTLLLIVVVINITKYVPEKQPVVELFLKEENAPFLAYTSIFAAVVGPIIEELFFRGFMYSAVRKYIGIFWAMLLTSALFALLHTNVVGFLPIMILGMLLAYLYEKTGTLVSSITVHAIHNLSMVFFVFLLKQLKV